MAVAFDTLGFSKSLQKAGVTVTQADAHAEAARDFIMMELATKADIAEVKHMIDKQGLVLTVRVGGIMIAGLSALAVLIKLL